MKAGYVATVQARGRFYLPVPQDVAKMLNIRDADLFKPLLLQDGKLQFERVNAEGEKG
jgi:hypothetical protein